MVPFYASKQELAYSSNKPEIAAVSDEGFVTAKKAGSAVITVKTTDGSKKKVYMRKHYNAMQPHISEDFVKLTQAFTDCGAAKNTVLGSADCILCDAAKVFDVTRHVLAPEPECLVTRERIEKERWADYI